MSHLHGNSTMSPAPPHSGHYVPREIVASSLAVSLSGEYKSSIDVDNRQTDGRYRHLNDLQAMWGGA